MLALVIKQGMVIYVNHVPVKVLSLFGGSLALLEVGNRKVKVYDDRSTNILPGVKVSCAPVFDTNSTKPRLVFEAAEEIEILRDKLYVKKYPERFSENIS